MFYQKLTSLIKGSDKKGVALFIVLTSMATLAIFLGEITYTSQVNQKLAYDRLDQIKAHSLAKSGLRIALLRIRAYSELKKTIGDMAKSTGATKDAVNSLVPKAILEKIWSEPITIPFSGDISSMPGSIKDALTKFRKDSGMEGKLYISIQAQSSKFNLNSLLAHFASVASSGTATHTATSTSTTTNTGTAVAYDPQSARTLLNEQLKQTFQKKFEDDEKFRDQYRSLKIEDLSEEIVGWCDLSYESQHNEQSQIQFKKAPYYDISELHYLPIVDDDIYDLIAPQFTAGVSSGINVNTITETVLKALVPQMTADEVKAFFEFRDSTGTSKTATSEPTQGDSGEDNTFKSADDFYKYIGDKVAAFKGGGSKIDDFKKALAQRGISLITDESNFIVRIEATVQQTKRTLEAMVTLVDSSSASTTGSPSPTPAQPTNNGVGPDVPERSNLKITQLRFL